MNKINLSIVQIHVYTALSLVLFCLQFLFFHIFRLMMCIYLCHFQKNEISYMNSIWCAQFTGDDMYIQNVISYFTRKPQNVQRAQKIEFQHSKSRKKRFNFSKAFFSYFHLLPCKSHISDDWIAKPKSVFSTYNSFQSFHWKLYQIRYITRSKYFER